MKIKDQLAQIILIALKNVDVDVDVDDVTINDASKPEFGDYQYNGVMGLAKKMKRNPREIASSVLEEIPTDGIISQCEVAGPGFINLWINTEWIAQQTQVLAGDERLGIKSTNEPVTVVVDYSSPNMAKEMHVGHLRSTIIGDTLSNLFAFLGDKVIRQNHIGDWGTQFGMLIAYLEDMGSDGGANLSDLEQFYKDAKKRFDSDPAFADTAREYVVKLQGGDAKCLKLWKSFIDTSLSHCENVYEKIGVKLTRDDVRAESSYNDDLARVVEKLDEKGLLTISDGAKCIFLDEDKPPFIVQKSDGGYLYSTTDFAAINHRVHDLKADRISYVVDARQAGHFKQLFTIARKAGFAKPETILEHVSFGMMLDKSGKPFKTRDGGTIKLIDLLDEAVIHAKDAISKRDQYSDDELEHIAQIVGIGAVKYADLSIHRDSNYIFDWDKMLSFDGNTSLYLQYAYARIQSILRKYNSKVSGDIRLDDPQERALAIKILQFEDMLHRAASESLPHYITTYLYELATQFMKFYETCPILKDDVDEPTRQSRLQLSILTAETIKTGLEILGIGVLDRL
jgi:arginyl-tRNA synthetase